MFLNKPKEMTKAYFPEITGKHPLITQINQMLPELAQSDVNIIITGEPGTGKKLLAQKIHALSKTAHRPFFIINGNQINTIENMNFVDQCTLFLDEITDIPLSVQIKLLRMLQEKKQHAIRIIASTTKNLEKAIQAGQLKEDLYYRLQAFLLHIPLLNSKSNHFDKVILSKVNHAKLTDIHPEPAHLPAEGVDLKMLLQALEENYIRQAVKV